MTVNGHTPPDTPLSTRDEGPQTPAKGAFLALGLLLGINLFNYIDRYILSANLENIEKAMLTTGGAENKERLGLLASAFMVTYMVFAPLFGWLADWVPRWRLVGVGVILWSLASGASGLAGTFWMLLLTRCCVGIGEAAYGPIAPAVLADLYPVRERGRVMAWFYVAIPIGSAVGLAFGGLAGWPDSFFWVVPPGLALGLLCFFMPDPARGRIDPKAARPVRHVRLRDYVRLLKNKSYVLNTLGMIGMTFSMGGLAHWMPYYVSTYRQAGDLKEVTSRFGILMFISGLLGTILGGLAGDWLRPRFSGSYFLVSGLAIFVAFPMFLAMVLLRFPFAWVPMTIASFCLFVSTGPTSTILANVTHPSLRAAAFALNIFIIHALGDAISPTVIGAIADRTNLKVGFLAMSGMLLLAAVCWTAGAKYLATDTANAEHQLDD